MDIKTLFNQYFLDVVKNHYVDYQGKATRPQFWYFLLFYTIIAFVAGFVFGLVHLPILAYVVILGLICPYICLAIRRLRDAGFPAWTIIGFFIPVVSLIMLVLLAMPTKAAK